VAATPLFSIVTPVYEPPLDVLEQTIESVLAQTFTDWEWVLVDDCSPSDEVRDLLHHYADRDPRIKVVEREVNGHIVAASNDAIRAAIGQFLVFLDHDDLLTTDALEANAAEIERCDDVDYLYSDEDKVDDEGRFYNPFYKPAWSPERLRGQMYTSHLSVARASVVKEVGGFRDGYDGSQDHDLVLRVTEVARRVVHIPRILYHWRCIPGSAASDINAKPYAHVAGLRAVQDHLVRTGIDGEMVNGPALGVYRVARRLDPSTAVSLVIPTIGTEGMVWGTRRVFVVEAVRSLLQHTKHPALEVVVVYDAPTPSGVLDLLREIAGSQLKLVPFEHRFNYSRKMNLGALHADGERLVLLNDDIEAISDRWVEQLVAPLDEPDVGMTGGKLYFGNGTIQHAGHAYALKQYHHPYIFEPKRVNGEFGELILNREVSGVTAACAAIRRDVYFEVGGFTEALPANFNDVDLSYKVRHRGYRIVWVNDVEMYHFESQSRERVVDAWEKEFTVARWGMPDRDEYLPYWPGLKP
jgi:GT2 family glycosyltransferase